MSAPPAPAPPHPNPTSLAQSGLPRPSPPQPPLRAPLRRYRDHLLGVMGDRRYLDADGRRKDPATRRFTEPPDPPPDRLYPGDLDRFPRLHQGEGSQFHNGDFSAPFNGGGVYGDDLRLGIEGYIRHDPRWGSVGCETRRVLDVIEPLMGADFRVVYTDGFVEYPGAKALSWHSGARPCRHAVLKQGRG